MVKRRYFLFLFYVAAISLVSCQDETEPVANEGPLVVATEDNVESIVTDSPNQSAVPYNDMAPSDDAASDNLPVPDENTTKKPKKPKKSTVAPVQQSCQQLVIAEQNDCLFNVPEGYDANSCKFEIKNADCDWECTCEAIVTEATTEEPLYTTESDSEEESLESCETDKTIKFKNCFIDIDGYVKRAKADSC